MANPRRARVYDDELHERRRKLALVQTDARPIDLQAERLARLKAESRETQDP